MAGCQYAVYPESSGTDFLTDSQVVLSDNWQTF